MITRRLVAIAGVVAALALAGAASTQAWSSLTGINHLRFGSPVALPGVVLAAGSYTFGVELNTPNLVRVLSRDGGQVMYQGFTTLVSRPARAEAPLVTFGEAPPGQPKPISMWYPARSTIGYQFRY